nr:hypothetical protein [Tanacetum cinerariifolium]
MVFKAPKTSSKVESVSKGTKHGAQTRYKKPLTSSKQPFVSSKEATKDSTAKADPGLSAPNDSIPQQQGMVEGTKNTSCDHIFVGTNPHVLVGQTKSISEGLETVLTQPITGKGANFIGRQVEEEEASSTIKLEDLAKLVSNVEPSFKYLDSPKDDPVITLDDSDEDEKDLNELLVKSLKSKFSKILSTHDFSSSLPTEMKDLPSKFNDLTKQVKGLKNQVHNLKIKLPGDLKEIPPKLEDITKTVTSLTSQVVELKTLQWELPAKFLVVPSQVKMVQTKLKTLDALPKEDAKAKAAKQEREVRKAELVDLLGPEVGRSTTMTSYSMTNTVTKFLIEEHYQEPPTVMIDQKGEGMKECPNRTRKGWETIYKQIGTRIDYIHMTEAELGINLDIALSKQGPLNKLYDLTNKKRKHADDIHDYFKANKRLKSSVQYKDYLPGTVLNEPIL